MDDPTTGRRRHRSGGVSVAQLVDRGNPVGESISPTPEPMDTAPTRHAAPGATTILSADAPPAESRAETEHGSSTLASVCRRVGLTVGVLAVCSAVTVAWAINQQEPQQQATAVPAHYEITGAQALRPDSVAAHLGEQRTARQDAQPGSAGPVHGPSDAQADEDRPPGRPDGADLRAGAAEGSTTSADAQVGRDSSPAALVRRFYELLARQPDRAAELLAPQLVGSDTASFVRSWSRMRDLRVEQVTTHPDGTVTAVVRMLEPDGTWLRVRQSLRTAGDELPRIDSVRLVSAQRG